MNSEKQRLTKILIVLSLISVILGFTGGYLIRSDSDPISVSGYMEELYIPSNLISSDLKQVIIELNKSYPHNVVIEDNRTILKGTEVIDAFNQISTEKGIDFMWETIPVTEGYVIYNGYAIPVGSANDSSDPLSKDEMYSFYLVGDDDDAGHTIVMTYDELELLLNGDNETKDKFWNILNASKAEEESHLELINFEEADEEHRKEVSEGDSTSEKME